MNKRNGLFLILAAGVVFYVFSRDRSPGAEPTSSIGVRQEPFLVFPFFPSSPQPVTSEGVAPEATGTLGLGEFPEGIPVGDGVIFT